MAAEDAAPGFLAEGSRFGPYRVGACIGRGGMACIYRAEHLGLRRQVALKVLMGEVAAGAESRARFLREARIAAGIKHPSVVDIYDVGVHDDIPFLVMELLVGHDLEAFLMASGVPDEGTLLDLMIPVVAALAAVHDAGVVHRDLKPGNIYLSKRKDGSVEPRLLDFGISRSFWRNEPRLTAVRQGVLIGTPLYMSPEAMLGREITPLSDQYSLGVVLYECTSGVNPFVANNIAEIVRRVTTGDFTPLAAQPTRPSRRMTEIIARVMSVDPAQRFPDMRALGRELIGLAGMRTRLTWGQAFGGLSAMALVRHDERPAPPPPPAVPAAPWYTSRLVALGAAAVLGGAAFAIGQTLLARSRSHFAPAADTVSADGAGAGSSAPRTSIAALKPASAAPAPSPAPATSAASAGGAATGPAASVPAAGSAEAPRPSEARGGAPAAASPAPAGSAVAASPAPDTAAAADPALRREAAANRSSSPRRPPAKATRRSTSKATRPRSEEESNGRGAQRAQERESNALPPSAPSAPEAAEAAPDWLPTSAPPRPRRPKPAPTETGTNDAPILD